MPATITRRLVTLGDAADALAVSTRTVRRYIADGQLEAVRPRSQDPPDQGRLDRALHRRAARRKLALIQCARSGHAWCCACDDVLMWVLDPANSPSLIASLRPHSIAPDFEIVFVGEGWRGLIEECHARLADEFPDYRFYAIKQKFGVLAYQATLRGGDSSHTDADRARVAAIVDKFEQRSATVCESCGRRGSLRDGRTVWITLCDDCDERWPDPHVAPR
ncbi:hypothetical protein ACJ5H2_09340 [Nocardioides sp. R1-1]|uniref:hypothetical protein n=1 Tax=Nocardioides sp. R1-1 TaxID=3383502 RepID=UPI0038D12BA3